MRIRAVKAKKICVKRDILFGMLNFNTLRDKQLGLGS
jgi:hypothetical protein